MKTNFLFLFLIISGAVSSTHAQPRVVSTSTGWLSIGTGHTSGLYLGRSLADAGLPIIENKPINFGFGGGIFLERLYLGGFGDIAVSNLRSDGALSTRTVSGSGGITTGFAVLNRHGFVLYPAIGLGVGGAELQIRGKETPEKQLSPGNRLNSAYGSIHAALHLDWYLWPNLRRGGLMIGFSAIQEKAFAVSDWTISKRSDGQPDADVVSSLSALDPSGFGLRFRIGWGVNGSGN